MPVEVTRDQITNSVYIRLGDIRLCIGKWEAIELKDGLTALFPPKKEIGAAPIGKVKYDAQLMALVAEMHALTASIAGMLADNAQRELNGESPAWPGDDFFKAQEALDGVAKKMHAFRGAG